MKFSTKDKPYMLDAASAASQGLLELWTNSPTVGLSHQPSFVVASASSLNHQTQFNHDDKRSNFKGSAEDKCSSLSSQLFTPLPENDKNHVAMNRSSSAPLDLERTYLSSGVADVPIGNYSDQIGTSPSALRGMSNLGSVHDLIASIFSQQMFNANVKQQSAPFMSSNHDILLRLMMLQQSHEQANSLLMAGGGMVAQSYSPHAHPFSQDIMLNLSSHHNQEIALANKAEDNL